MAPSWIRGHLVVCYVKSKKAIFQGISGGEKVVRRWWEGGEKVHHLENASQVSSSGQQSAATIHCHMCGNIPWGYRFVSEKFIADYKAIKHSQWFKMFPNNGHIA